MNLATMLVGLAKKIVNVMMVYIVTEWKDVVQKQKEIIGGFVYMLWALGLAPIPYVMKKKECVPLNV